MSISPTLRGTGNGVVPERRACQRRSVIDRRLVTVNLDDKDTSLMVDISEAGIAVQALARINQGASTSLQFELPNTATRIEALGTVAWVDPMSGRAGIRFQKLDEAAATCLLEWLGSTGERRPTARAAIPAAVPSLLGPDSKVAAIAALQREITIRSLDTEAALALIVERARGLTRADGAAVAIGDSKLMTCRASSGSAPPIGAALLPESGLSGECVRTGMTVRCEDTELDPRVDREACRCLQLGSAVVVPLFTRGNISGVVEIFYASPRGFEGRDVLTLRRIADLISATVCAPVPRQPDTPARACTAVAAHPPRNLEPVHVIAPARVISPTTRVTSGAQKVVCDVCGHENPIAIRDCEKCDVPLPGRTQQEQAQAAAEDFLPERQGLQAEVTSPWLAQIQPRRRIVLRLTARARVYLLIAALLLARTGWGWQRLKARRVSAAPPVNTTSAAEVPMLPSATAPTSASEISFELADLRSSRLPDGQKKAAVIGKKEPLTLAKNVVATAPAPPLATTSTPVVATILSTPAVAPNLSAAIPSAATVSPARLLSHVEPVYPKQALASHLQGAVVLKASILGNGRLGMIQVVSGNDLLVGAAVHAVEQWRYKPMELDGKPVESETTIKMSFSLAPAR